MGVSPSDQQDGLRLGGQGVQGHVCVGGVSLLLKQRKRLENGGGVGGCGVLQGAPWSLGSWEGG